MSALRPKIDQSVWPPQVVLDRPLSTNSTGN